VRVWAVGPGVAGAVGGYVFGGGDVASHPIHALGRARSSGVGELPFEPADFPLEPTYPVFGGDLASDAAHVFPVPRFGAEAEVADHAFPVFGDRELYGAG
jgi:hypothetical protein